MIIRISVSGGIKRQAISSFHFCSPQSHSSLILTPKHDCFSSSKIPSQKRGQLLPQDGVFYALFTNFYYSLVSSLVIFCWSWRENGQVMPEYTEIHVTVGGVAGFAMPSLPCEFQLTVHTTEQEQLNNLNVYCKKNSKFPIWRNLC